MLVNVFIRNTTAIKKKKKKTVWQGTRVNATRKRNRKKKRKVYAATNSIRQADNSETHPRGIYILYHRHNQKPTVARKKKKTGNTKKKS